MANDVKSQKKNLTSKIKDIIKGLIKDITLGRIFPSTYSRAAEAAVDKRKVLFLDAKEVSLPDSFRLLYKRFDDDDNYDVEYISLMQHSVSYVQYYKNCRAAIKKIATAQYVFLCDASDVVSCLPMREETSVIQLWHACGAFKKWGMSTADLEFGGSRKQIMRHPFYKNLSLVTVSSPDVIWAYVEAMTLEGQEEIVKPLGVSRTDVFFDESFLSSARQRVCESIPQARDKKILLYAPTFRGRVSKALGPDQLDVEAFRKAFEGDYILLTKHHPFVKSRPVISPECSKFAFDVSRSLSIEDLLCVADVCITDYSSLVFEYSLFEKPIVFFAYDKVEYDDWRGFYYDYEDLTPGPVCESNEQMIDYLLHLGERFDKEAIIAFKKRFMSACDGHATDRILKEVFNGQR